MTRLARLLLLAVIAAAFAVVFAHDCMDDVDPDEGDDKGAAAQVGANDPDVEVPVHDHAMGEHHEAQAAQAEAMQVDAAAHPVHAAHHEAQAAHADAVQVDAAAHAVHAAHPEVHDVDMQFRDLTSTHTRFAAKERKVLEQTMTPFASMVAVEVDAHAQTRITFTAHKLLDPAPAWLTVPDHHAYNDVQIAYPVALRGGFVAHSHRAPVEAIEDARATAHDAFGVQGPNDQEARSRVEVDIFLVALVNHFNAGNNAAWVVRLHPELHVAPTNWRTSLWPPLGAGATAAPHGQDTVSGFIDYAITNHDGTRIYMVVEVKAYNHGDLLNGRGRRQAAMEAAYAMHVNPRVHGLPSPVPFVLTDGDDWYFYLLRRGAHNLEVSYYGTYRAAGLGVQNIFLRLRRLLAEARFVIG